MIYKVNSKQINLLKKKTKHLSTSETKTHIEKEHSLTYNAMPFVVNRLGVRVDLGQPAQIQTHNRTKNNDFTIALEEYLLYRNRVEYTEHKAILLYPTPAIKRNTRIIYRSFSC